ncbi:DNA cytosine methyltransferase [uncultured Rikenella sp.]|uniref:DNA cytosine methyltransferase n=1 Tax=uncultured Rikenella sp. TaxID=368003 RepID=UPI0025FF6E46|nr:DNA cytosine methyltransferase [uncultured Rikenella sp.]
MIKLLYIDLFCGAGGTSTGVENARIDGRKCAKVIACVNHDANAIASHAANHPDAMHFTEDIRTLDLAPLAAHVSAMRELYPTARVVLWASLECTNFSKAKGGLPRDADSRTLADHLFRYIEALNPEYIQIENVEEFMSWGDLDERGKPISRDAGRLYRQWVGNVCGHGYRFEHRILNAADYGAYTSRRRFFGQFARPDLPIAWPRPTHSKTGSSDLFGSLKKWKPVREVLNFEDAGRSIFGRKKPLVDATLERIYAGLIKFVAGGKEAFMVKYNSMSKRGVYHAPSIDDPCPVVATQSRLGLAKAHFIQQRHSGNPARKIVSVDGPARTLTTTGGNQDLVQAHFLAKHFSGRPEGKCVSVDGPAGAVTVRDHHALVGARFLQVYYGNGFSSSVESPAPTVTTKDRFQLVSPCFLDMQYGNGKPADINAPAPTITSTPKQNLVQPWILNPQYRSPGGSVDAPCFTLIARMDKMPPYLMGAERGSDSLPTFVRSVDGGMIYEIYSDDTPAMVKIKEFMALYGLSDITMRMLRIPELKRIQGFPSDYVLIGTQEEQKKYIGNAVVTEQAEAICVATCAALEKIRLTA